MKRNLIYGASAFLLTASLSLTSCQNEEMTNGNANGKEVLLTVTATRDNDATRATLAPVGGDLKCTWDGDDQLVVYTENNVKLGVLDINKEDAGKSTAVFTGTVTLPETGIVCLSYTAGREFNTSDQIEVDFSSQAGTLKALDSFDVMQASAQVTEFNNEASATVTMTHQVAFGYFNLDLGTQLEAGDVVTITAENLKNKTGFKGNMGTVNKANASNSISVTVPADGNSFYIAMPTGTYDPTFKVSKGGYNYTATPGSHNWTTNMFVRADENGNPASIGNWTKEKEPINGGDTGNWGGDSQEPEYHKETINLISKADGWTLNVSTTYGESYGGFGYYIGYDQNGIVNGILSSKNNGQSDVDAIYYQWGRWLGFTYTAGFIYLTDKGSGSWNDNVVGHSHTLPAGVNYFNTKIGYSWANSLSGSYVCAYMGANSSWTKQRAINCSICYGLGNSLSGHLDYVYNNEDCTWEERGGNPAPDGYAIPTMAQLEALMPNTGSIESNKVEFKTVEGKRYAMKWVVTTEAKSNLPAVEIRSFETSDANVSVNDSRFTNANPIMLVTHGYLDNEGGLKNEGIRGYFWSNESGKNTISGTSGNGGKALHVYINGNNITMSSVVLPRTFAANVLLIKDDTKKSDSIKPWFPLTGVGTTHW